MLHGVGLSFSRLNTHLHERGHRSGFGICTVPELDLERAACHLLFDKGLTTALSLLKIPPLARSRRTTIAQTLSCNILFNRLTLAATLVSIVRSPISTTRPPRIDGSIFALTLSFLPWLYSDFATAASIRFRVRLSSSCQLPSASRPTSISSRVLSEHTCALTILNSNSPLPALISSPNFSAAPSNSPNRLFTASVERKFLTVPLLSAPPVCFSNSATISALSDCVRVGAPIRPCSLGSFLRTCRREAMARAVPSRVDCFAAAVYWRV